MLTREQAVLEFPQLGKFDSLIEHIDSDIRKCEIGLPKLVKPLVSIRRAALLHKNVAFHVATTRDFVSIQAKRHLSNAISLIVDAAKLYMKAEMSEVSKKMAGV